MTIDLDRIRQDTPSLADYAHLIASGASIMPDPVLNAVTNHLALEARLGGYEAHHAAADALDGIYPMVADFIGAKPREIALVENATVAWCLAFYSLDLKKGDRILTCQSEYAANYVAYLQRAKRDGIIIDVIPNDEYGAIDVAAAEEMISDRTALIAITWIPTNGGLVNPAAAIGDVAQRNNIPYLIDACQAVGQMPVSVTELKCDFLSATGRKFLRGPRGTGFLYVREALIETIEPVMIDYFAAPWVSKEQYQLRNDARRFENWENAYALRAGLGAAVAYAGDIGIHNIQARAWQLADLLRAKLKDVPGTEIKDLGSEQCAIISFTIEGLDPPAVVAALRKQKIHIGSSDPDSTRLDSDSRNLPVMLRAAPHYYNTEDELDHLVVALQKMKTE